MKTIQWFCCVAVVSSFAVTSEAEVRAVKERGEARSELRLIDPDGRWLDTVLTSVFQEVVGIASDSSIGREEFAQIDYEEIAAELTSLMAEQRLRGAIPTAKERSLFLDYMTLLVGQMCPATESGCEFVASTNLRAEPGSAEGVILGVLTDAIREIDSLGFDAVKGRLIDAAIERLNIHGHHATERRQIGRFMQAALCPWLFHIARYTGDAAIAFTNSCLPEVKNASAYLLPGTQILVIDNMSEAFNRIRTNVPQRDIMSVAEGIAQHGITPGLLALVDEGQWEAIVNSLLDMPVKTGFIATEGGGFQMKTWFGVKIPGSSPVRNSFTPVLDAIRSATILPMPLVPPIMAMGRELPDSERGTRFVWFANLMFCIMKCQNEFLHNIEDQEVTVTTHIGTDGVWMEFEVTVPLSALLSLQSCLTKCF